MNRYIVTITNLDFANAWGCNTFVAEGNVHDLRVVDAPNRSLIGEPIKCISADGEPIEEQLAAMYGADVQIQPLD